LNSKKCNQKSFAQKPIFLAKTKDGFFYISFAMYENKGTMNIYGENESQK
jgi:hypothetical protein